MMEQVVDKELISRSGSRTSRTLTIEELTVSFGGLKAVNDLSVEVPQGQFVAVVGPNGAGKSTLLQAITGFYRPEKGSIRFGDGVMNGRAPHEIASFGIARTFQTSRVFPTLTVWESVMVGTQTDLIGGGRLAKQWGGISEPLVVLLGRSAYRRHVDKLAERAEGIMKLFGDRLWARRDDPAYSLSYANRRRLDIARALVSEPDLLLLDEPTAGMNPTETQELSGVLAELHGQRPDVTVIMVEHKLDVVRRLANRALVMNQGALLVDETPEAALEDPRVVEAYLGQKGVRKLPSDETPGSPHARVHPVASPDVKEVADENVVSVENVDVFYGAVQALFDVSVRVDRGEIVVVLGGNASGKSTTLKTVLGLVRPRTGAVSVLGQRTLGWATGRVIDLGVASIPEGRRMFAEMSVRDNLLLGAYVRRSEPDFDVEREIELAISQFPWIKDRLNQLAGTLSGGEQQMVAMVRAWLRRPRLLCVDEPSMGLSPRLVDQVYDILFRWKDEGLTILMVEQNVNRALELADRAYVLRNGHIMIEGRSEDLRNDPAIRKAYLGK